MRNLLLVIAVIILAAVGGYFFLIGKTTISFISPLASQIQKKAKPLEKYTFANLKKMEPETSKIILEKIISEEDNFTSHLFSYISAGKRITGQINLPSGKPPENGFPVILMLRGYIDPEVYSTGDGTRNAAKVFAKNGFITLAPDFLPENTLPARLKRPYNLLTLINSLASLSQTSISNLGIWAHSNGGQIALSLLEITGKSIPTTLWAPVSKSFPYSILYYTDEYEDKGKALRKVIAEFEIDYDVNNYSIHNYYDWITAPIQVHQGTADDAVPKEWSDELVDRFKKEDIDVTYYIYPGADHDLRPAWNTVINRDLIFFNNYLK